MVENRAFAVQQMTVLVVRQMLTPIRRTVLCPVRCTLLVRGCTGTCDLRRDHTHTHTYTHTHTHCFTFHSRSAFSLVPRLSTRHCPHLLLSAVLRRSAAERACRWYASAAPAPAAVDRYLLPAERSAANPPAITVAAGRWDRQTDGRSTVS